MVNKFSPPFEPNKVCEARPYIVFTQIWRPFLFGTPVVPKEPGWWVGQSLPLRGLCARLFCPEKDLTCVLLITHLLPHLLGRGPLTFVHQCDEASYCVLRW